MENLDYLAAKLAVLEQPETRKRCCVFGDELQFAEQGGTTWLEKRVYSLHHTLAGARTQGRNSLS